MGIYDYIKTWDQIILDWFDGNIIAKLVMSD